MRTLYAITDGYGFVTFVSKYRTADMTTDIDNAKLYATKADAEFTADMENNNRSADMPRLTAVAINITRSL